MNKNYIIVGVVLVALVIAVGGWYMSARPPEGAVQEGAVMDKEKPQDGGAMADKDSSNGGAMMDKSSSSESGAMMDKQPASTDTAPAGGAMMDKGSASGGGAMTDGGAMMKTGSYEAYAPEKIAKAQDGKVILFFRASWCPTCRALDADIRANATKIPGGVYILDVNYDNSSALKQKYGVTYQHTLVQVAADGSQIAKWSGSPTLTALLGQVK